MVDAVQQIFVSLGQGEAGVAADLLASAAPTDALGESLFLFGDAYAEAEMGSPAGERVLELTGDLQAALNIRDSRRARRLLANLGAYLRVTPEDRLKKIAGPKVFSHNTEKADSRRQILELWNRLEVPSTAVGIFTIALWQRSEEERQFLEFSEEALVDQSNQVLVVRDVEGKIIGGMVLRLFRDAETGKIGIFYSFSPQNVLDHLPEAVYEKLMEISKAQSVAHSTYPVEQFRWPTLLPFFPVTAPSETETAALLVLARSHPHQKFHYITDGAVREAMKEVEGAMVVISPWLGRTFPLDLADLARREIEPDPKVDKAKEYLWAFASGGFGRSVDYDLGDEGMLVQKTRWYHLSGIGVGRTLNARVGDENRDGRLSLEVAWQRFYLTNLLHTIAGDVGFRTSLGVAVTDLGRVRKGFGKNEAVIYELRRENLRLWDLEKADLEMAGKIIDYVKEKVAKELGRETMTREEYVRWLAKTLGEQFAIMEYFGFDHGVDEGYPQLHAGNVSLLGEIFDSDTGRLQQRETRYRNNEGVDNNHVDMEHIRQMQEIWKGSRKKVAEETDEPTWIERLLDFAPHVHFYDELRQARYSKLAELRRLWIDPRQRIRQFNEQVWNPFAKSRKTVNGAGSCRAA